MSCFVTLTRLLRDGDLVFHSYDLIASPTVVVGRTVVDDFRRGEGLTLAWGRRSWEVNQLAVCR